MSSGAHWPTLFEQRHSSWGTCSGSWFTPGSWWVDAANAGRGRGVSRGSLVSMIGRRTGGPSSRPQMTSVVWGRRLEAALILGHVIGARVQSPLGPSGAVLAGGLPAIARWQSPATRDRTPQKLVVAQDGRSRRRAGRRRVGSRRLEERIEEFNQTPLLTELPRCSRSSPGSQRSQLPPIVLHPNGASQPLYLVKVQSRSLDIEEGHDECR